ncbi:hypothetical protein NF27_IN00890 [Candidatus Jidaibacter acanthamoeba]|uniref:Uncharacterized protein n=1 Tax=Candidatus Jidaibacter acanthamoebae TaxID=86105 RepID=A0A0C1QJI8_9RICK|nr:hypothetical protein [Candidatus Jidaibacter acanthamoeba]KIE04348.1 hypothetical protein NF27_IN00890 [Candidatus Jidaibacter acanthamoeba]
MRKKQDKDKAKYSKRYRSSINAFVNIISGLIAYCFKNRNSPKTQ